jgi:phosphoglycerol transferase MdoB-like AlkP superfamily enzyme
LLFLSAAAVTLALALHRLLLVSLPFFAPALAEAPVKNVACGLLSDASLAAIFWAVALAAASSRRAAAGFGRVALVLATVFVLTLGIHLRYVEHFGMTLRPYHFAAIGTGEVWGVGMLMVFQSWRADVLMIAGVAFLVGAARTAETLQSRWSSRSGGVRVAAVVAALVVAAASQSGMINLRMKPGMHGELRYNPVAGLFYNFMHYRNVLAVPPPQRATLGRLRALLAGERTFVDATSEPEFPLWQSRLASGERAGEDVAYRDRLRAYLASEAAAKGPWNVVLVLSESLRAHEIASMGDADDLPEAAALTPNLTRLGDAGVRFTRVMSSGLRTHFGQTGALCSLYGADDATLMQDAPMSRARCLPEVFADKGYETFFFYGADNHFDNQGIFYQAHGMKHVFGEADMPQGIARGGWGASDKALFEFTVDKLSGAKTPFFAAVMTLTNHAPYRVPSDAPPEAVDEAKPERLQLLQYVDWSTGWLWSELEKRLPHTIFVVVADHGRFWDEEVPQGLPTWEQLSRVARIPLYVAIPGLPVELGGRAVDRLASNTDVPPTILSLLGWEQEPQSFMGLDAFARVGPVMIDWQTDLLALTPRETGAVEVSLVDASLEIVVSSLSRFNLVTPPPSTLAAPKGG